MLSIYIINKLIVSNNT
ncbi:hypothetical protein [Escherichia coli]